MWCSSDAAKTNVVSVEAEGSLQAGSAQDIFDFSMMMMVVGLMMMMVGAFIWK